ncbi:hypothetical protein Mapa_002815 [Marchantia paleacea]|nr:hypothetical protein Mapa_002815 [Marchantia paleacea]
MLGAIIRKVTSLAFIVMSILWVGRSKELEVISCRQSRVVKPVLTSLTTRGNMPSRESVETIMSSNRPTTPLEFFSSATLIGDER